MGVRPSPLTYPACPLDRNGRTCNKKMQSNDDNTGLFHCETCGRDEQPTYRYVLQCHILDFEGGRENVSAFGDQGEALMGMPAGQAHEVCLVIAVLPSAPAAKLYYAVCLCVRHKFHGVLPVSWLEPSP